MQTYEQICLSLKKKEYAPLYFLCGEESYYIDLLASWFENNILDEASKAFDMTILYGQELQGDITRAISEARANGMMGRKIVIVKEAQTIKKWETLAAYVSVPNPQNILVICYKYGSPDKRLKLFKDLDKQAVMMQSDKLRDYEINKWIVNYIRQWNDEHKDDAVQIDEKIAQILADNLGNDLTKIVGEMQKLLLGRPKGVNVIDSALVERNVGISKDFNVFELQSALIQGDAKKANQITQYFADSKDHPIQKELIVLFNFFANLMIFHYVADKSDDKGAASKMVGVSPYFVKDYRAASKRFSKGKTMRIIGYIRDIDAKSKGMNNLSAKDGDLWKELIYNILH